MHICPFLYGCADVVQNGLILWCTLENTDIKNQIKYQNILLSKVELYYLKNPLKSKRLFSILQNPFSEH